jgi:hypothetical protein
MIKKFGVNLFLFSILLGLLILPITSFKLLKIQQLEVLGTTNIREQYLQQRVEEQEERIKELETLLEEAKETTQSKELLAE